jgi:hypothetical protein
VWSQQLERGIFLHAENAFHEVVKSVASGRGIANHDAVTEYFLVWQIRANLAKRPPEDLALNGVSESTPLTRNDEEVLEKKGFAFLRGNVVPGRLNAWFHARRDLDYSMSNLAGTRWGIVRARDGVGFVCP